MVRALVGRIATVVRREDQQILRAHQRLDLRQGGVNVFERLAKALGIASVAPEHIGIDQVREAQAVKIAAHIILPGFNAGRVSGSVIGARQADMVKDVFDLADAKALHPGFLDCVQHGSADRRQGEIAAPGRAGEVPFLPDVGAGDDAADTQRTLEHFARDRAEMIELLARENVLMAGDLEHAVRGCVDDRGRVDPALLAQLVEDGRAGGRLVADHAVADRLFILLQEFGREAVREGREGLFKPKSGNFPVAGGRVLARADFHAAARAADGALIRSIVGAGHLAETDFCQIRQMGMCGIDRMAQGIGALIAIVGRIRRMAAAHGIQHCQKYTFHV